MPVLFAALTPAPEAPFYGYPPWLVVLIASLVLAAALWVFAKLIKWALIVAIALVLVSGVMLAVKLFLGSS